jgi:hypothetical protein
MMGKGGYIGGGTIIGPHTPDWFGNGGDEVPEPEPQAEPTAPPTPSYPAPGSGKTNRHQRRKRAKAMQEARQHPSPPPPMMVAKPKRELSASADQRIAKLRVHISGLELGIASCQQALDRSRDDLNGVLKEYGLPLQRPSKP